MNIDRDLEVISQQERELRWTSFGEADAWNLGSRLRETAIGRSLPVVIDVRRFGHALFYTSLSGTTPDNVEWVRRKSNIVARFLRSSYAIGLALQRDSATLSAKFGLSDSDYASHGGSFPITVVNAGVIGSITVSGLPQREDHELVVEALSATLGRDYSALALSVQNR